MTPTPIDFATIVPRFDEALARGLCAGVGDRNGQMCVEAAICYALDLPHGDDPPCVEASVRTYKIRLNDTHWSSPQARAAGLRHLGIAQLGSKGVVDGATFRARMQLLTIQRLLPPLFKEVWPTGEMDAHVAAMQGATDNVTAQDAATTAADAAAATTTVAYAAAATATTAAYAAASDATAYAAAATATTAAYASDATATAYASARANNTTPDYYLRLSADLAFEVLVELQSPGALWLLAQERE